MTLKGYIEELNKIILDNPEVGNYTVKLENFSIDGTDFSEPFLDYSIAEFKGESIIKYYSIQLPHKEANTIIL